MQYELGKQIKHQSPKWLKIHTMLSKGIPHSLLQTAARWTTVVPCSNGGVPCLWETMTVGQSSKISTEGIDQIKMS